MSHTRFGFDFDTGAALDDRNSPRILLPHPNFDRIRELDLAERRVLKQIVRGRMRGENSETIAAAIGSINVYMLGHLSCIYGLPTIIELRRRRVQKLAKMKLSAKAIAKRMGISVNAVNEYRKDLGLPVFPRTKNRSSPRSKHVPDIIRMAGEGMTCQFIAKQLSISAQRVSQLRHKLGLPSAHGRR